MPPFTGAGAETCLSELQLRVLPGFSGALSLREGQCRRATLQQCRRACRKSSLVSSSAGLYTRSGSNAAKKTKVHTGDRRHHLKAPSFSQTVSSSLRRCDQLHGPIIHSPLGEGNFIRGSSPVCHAAATEGTTPFATPLPNPPAGFILNESGEVVLMAAESKRLITLSDTTLNRTLDCVIRRTFLSSSGLQFFLLYPLDVPVVVYRLSTTGPGRGEGGGLIEVEDEELMAAFPAASYALARRNFHLVLSGFVLTVRGAVCFNEDDVSSMNVEYGMGIGSNLSEGVEIASFAHKGGKYVVYTPFDPLLFVAYRDPGTGLVVVAEDEEQLDDPKVEEAIEEEQEYQRMANEEEDMAQIMKSKAK